MISCVYNCFQIPDDTGEVRCIRPSDNQEDRGLCSFSVNKIPNCSVL